MSKRRKGFPSEARVKRGTRVVHGNKELLPREARPEWPVPLQFGTPVSRTAACRPVTTMAPTATTIIA